jgi:PPP family 3-phenylpropionic acid transporter
MARHEGPPANSGQKPGGGLALRLSVFFGALFLIHGVHLTYLPVWLDGRGLSPTEIAIASSAPMLMRLVLTPWMAFLADRSSAHREMIVAACAVALGLMLAMKFATGVVLVLMLVIFMHVALQTIMPMADTVTMAAVKERGLDYGRIRLWGSATFIVASYIAGYAVAASGPEIVLHLSIIGGVLTAAAALWLPRAERASSGADGDTGRKRLTLADALALAKDRAFLLFLITAGAIQASHAVLYVFGVLHWRSQGLSAGYIATLWAISVLAEIALFWASRWVTPIGALRLMTIGGAAGLIRWLAMAFDPAAHWLVPLQLLHAGTFAATHLGAMHWIASHVPAKTSGTAQALLSAFTTGVAMSAAMLVSGPLYANFAGQAYLAMVTICAVGLAAAWKLEARTRQSRPAALS